MLTVVSIRFAPRIGGLAAGSAWPFHWGVRDPAQQTSNWHGGIDARSMALVARLKATVAATAGMTAHPAGLSRHVASMASPSMPKNASLG